MANGLILALSNSVEGKDGAFNRWYDEQHLGDVLDVPGIVAARRYDLAPTDVPEDQDLPAEIAPPAHRYLAIYEVDGDPDAVMNEMISRVGTGNVSLSDALELSTVTFSVWRPRGDRRLSP